MTLSPRLNKFALTTHVTFSVGWLGAVAGFLALAIAGLTSREPQMVRAAYLAMEWNTWFVIVPLSFAAPLTGLVLALGTKWGLFRHYWVLVKILITIPSTIFLLFHLQPIGFLAGVAAQTTAFGADLDGLRFQLAADAGAALLVLLVATTVAVYKPWGVTPYGARKQHEQPGVSQQISERRLTTTTDEGDTRTADLPSHPGFNDGSDRPTNRESTTSTNWGRYVLFGIVGLALLFAGLHLAGGGLGNH